MSPMSLPAEEAVMGDAAQGTNGHHQAGSCRTRKVVCQVQGCCENLEATGKAYCIKRRTCLRHMRASAVARKGFPEGKLFRFCFQCGKFEPLAVFDGEQRSCRVRLQMRKKSSRRKASELPPTDSPAADDSDAAGAGSSDSNQQQQRKQTKQLPALFPGMSDPANPGFLFTSAYTAAAGLRAVMPGQPSLAGPSCMPGVPDTAGPVSGSIGDMLKAIRLERQLLAALGAPPVPSQPLVNRDHLTLDWLGSSGLPGAWAAVSAVLPDQRTTPSAATPGGSAVNGEAAASSRPAVISDNSSMQAVISQLLATSRQADGAPAALGMASLAAMDTSLGRSVAAGGRPASASSAGAPSGLACVPSSLADPALAGALLDSLLHSQAAATVSAAAAAVNAGGGAENSSAAQGDAAASVAGLPTAAAAACGASETPFSISSVRSSSAQLAGQLLAEVETLTALPAGVPDEPASQGTLQAQQQEGHIRLQRPLNAPCSTSGSDALLAAGPSFSRAACSPSAVPSPADAAAGELPLMSAIQVAKQVLQRRIAAKRAAAAAAAASATFDLTACSPQLEVGIAASLAPFPAGLRTAADTLPLPPASVCQPPRAVAAQDASSNEAAPLISAIEQLMASIGGMASTQVGARAGAASTGMLVPAAQAGPDFLQLQVKQDLMQHSQLQQAQLPVVPPLFVPGNAAASRLQTTAQTNATASLAVMKGRPGHHVSGNGGPHALRSMLLQQHEQGLGQSLQSGPGASAAHVDFRALQQEAGAAAAVPPGDAELMKQIWLVKLREKHAEVQRMLDDLKAQLNRG